MELTAEKNVQTQLSAQNETEDKKEHIVNIDFKMVTFSLVGKDYAIDIMRVKEIAKAGRFTYVPNTSHFVLGVYNLRGDIIPIIDLRLFFGIPVEERKGNEIENMIIVTVGEQTFGVVVDAIDKVVGIQKSSIQPPHPLFGDINIKYIYGVVENSDRLYVLLDIERIFGHKTPLQQETNKNADPLPQEIKKQPGKIEKKSAASENQKQKPVPEPDIDYSFIVDSLQTLKKFTVSPVNDGWVKNRFNSWLDTQGKDKIQLTDEASAEGFLAPFYSACTGQFWTKEYADAVFAALPENSARQITVWNPGCGKGYETYSLACVLKKRYPGVRLRIYAQDVDLLSVSNAPLLTVPADISSGWMAPYVIKNLSGASVFNQEIAESVLFEYHDCVNATTMPGVDLILCRDVISFLKKESQDLLFLEFCDKLKGNGILIIGDNETINGRSEFDEKMTGSIVVLSKK